MASCVMIFLGSSAPLSPKSESQQENRFERGWVTGKWSGLLGNLMFAWAAVVGIAEKYVT
jgi:hypothetical protein